MLFLKHPYVLLASSSIRYMYQTGLQAHRSDFVYTVILRDPSNARPLSHFARILPLQHYLCLGMKL